MEDLKDGLYEIKFISEHGPTLRKMFFVSEGVWKDECGTCFPAKTEIVTPYLLIGDFMYTKKGRVVGIFADYLPDDPEPFVNESGQQFKSAFPKKSPVTAVNPKPETNDDIWDKMLNDISKPSHKSPKGITKEAWENFAESLGISTEDKEQKTANIKNHEKEGKPRPHVVPLDLVLEILVPAYEEGRVKYPPESHRQGFDLSIMYDSLIRHLKAFYFDREWYDREALEKYGIEKTHIGGAIFALISMYNSYQVDREGFDDRPKTLQEKRFKKESDEQ